MRPRTAYFYAVATNTERTSYLSKIRFLEMDHFSENNGHWGSLIVFIIF